MESPSPDAANRKWRRRRPQACVACRQKKLRCDHRQPCGSCLRAKDKNIVCSYGTAPPAVSHENVHLVRSPQQHEQVEGLALRRNSESRTALSPGAVVPSTVLRHESRQPPEQLESQERSHKWYSSNDGDLVLEVTTPTKIFTEQSSVDCGLVHLKNHSNATRGGIFELLQGLTSPISSIMVRTRYILPSSWLYSTLLLPRNVAWLERVGENKGECYTILEACNTLSKRFRSQLQHQWIYGQYGKRLGQKAIADVLLGNYLRTFETVYRILHVPNFLQQFDSIWQNDSNKPTEFVIQAQTCLALGALFYDESFSLRSEALQWIQEAGVWLESSARPRSAFSTVQTMCLHRLARETMQGTDGEKVWILSGSLFRAALAIGLHRDPTRLPGISKPQAEMRRRLWMTVLELTLSSSLDPGAMPLMPLQQSDCGPPLNYDDEQLDLEGDDIPLPSKLEHYTDSSVSIALGESLGLRTKIATFCTNFNVYDYEKTLELSATLSKACRSLSATLSSMGSRVTGFQHRHCEMTLLRYTFVLHLPYMLVSGRNPSHMLSRKLCVDAAVNLSYSFLPLSLEQGILQAVGTQHSQCEEYMRLCICGSGQYRSVPFQALMIIASELMSIADDWKNSFGWSASSRTNGTLFQGNLRGRELLALLHGATTWTKQRLRTGQETNKDHLFVALAIASVEASAKNEPITEAMDESGRLACAEEKAVLEKLTEPSTGGVLPEMQFGPDGDGFLGLEDMWLIQNGDIDINFLGFQ